MKYTEFKNENISILFAKYPQITHIYDALTLAYKMIFNEHCTRINKLEDEKINIINGMIKSCFELLKTLPKYYPENDPEYDILRMMNIAIIHWFFNEYQNKIKKQELTKNKYIWQIPPKAETNLRRKFKSRFNASPEQLIASCFFYLLPFLIKSVKEQDLWNYGAIISAVSENKILIQKNAKYIAGGKKAHTSEKRLENTYKKLVKDYRDIIRKPFDEQILYCQEHYNLNEYDAKKVLLMFENRNKK